MPEKPHNLLSRYGSYTFIFLVYFLPAVGIFTQHQFPYLEDWAMFSKGIVSPAGPICHVEFKYRDANKDLRPLTREDFRSLLDAHDAWGLELGHWPRLFIYNPADLERFLAKLCPKSNNEIYTQIKCYNQHETPSLGAYDNDKNVCTQFN